MMMKKNRIPLYELVNCVSDSIDLVDESLTQHHKRVAYISCLLGLSLGLSNEELQSTWIAASLHDIGAISTSIEEQNELGEFDIVQPHKHAILGQLLLQEYYLFKQVAGIVKHHHTDWNYGALGSFFVEGVSKISHIIHLSDRVDVLLLREENILNQAESVRSMIKEASGRKFDPELVEHFLKISNTESFWLDLEYPPLAKMLEKSVSLPEVEMDVDQLESFGKFIGNIIDFRSRFTATHSSGVAASAKKLAELSGMSKEKAKLLALTGYVHDIGKLAVPREILEKPEALTEEDRNIIKKHSYLTRKVLENVKALNGVTYWASSHHERLDGTGYPNRCKGSQLDDGTRILAVADVFTALSEDRPYRAGMHSDQVKFHLNELANSSAFDPHFVSLLMDHYDEVDVKREEAQLEAAMKYSNLQVQAERYLTCFLVCLDQRRIPN